MLLFVFFFFFQAEDGIRDYKVTGVQTCALPICDGFEPGRLKIGSHPDWIAKPNHAEIDSTGFLALRLISCSIGSDNDQRPVGSRLALLVVQGDAGRLSSLFALCVLLQTLAGP